jgi:hypothetical protein
MLLEDDDGAPLPEQFQRPSHTWDLVHEVTHNIWQTDEIMRRLARCSPRPTATATTNKHDGSCRRNPDG